MDLSTFFLAMAITAGVVGVIFALRILSFLQARGQKIHWIFIKLMIIKYIHQYRNITIKETGKAGPLYRSYIAAMLTALTAVIVGMALR